MKRNNPEDIVYIVRGIIWFGNKCFLEKITVFDEKENKAKEKFIKQKFPNIENFSLFMNKYVPIIIKASIIRRNKKEWLSVKSKSIDQESKKIFLNSLIEKTRNREDTFNFSEAATKLREYVKRIRESLGNQGYKQVIYQSFTTQSRLVVGLGSSHVLETALTLHHTYGIPYIPGSALKGVCRAVAFWKLAEKKGILNNEKEIKELSEKFYGKLVENDDDILSYQLLFGAQDFKGLLLFLDSYPIIEENTDIFELDIMNNHYSSYYGEGKPPGDWENPVPIYFLTVKPGIKFNICVLFDEFRWNKLKELEKFKNKNDVINEVEKLVNGDFLEEILKIAISQFGVGAKGRLGYGILE